MQSYLALYRGDTLVTAKLVAVSSDPALVGEFAGRLLTDAALPRPVPADVVLREVERGRRRALRLVAQEAAAVAGAEGE